MNYIAIWNIIKLTFLETTKGKLWKWLFGSFPGFCAVFFFASNYLDQHLLISIKWAAIIIGSFFAIRFISLGIRNSFKYLHNIYKESVYGEAIILLKNSFGEAHQYRKAPGYQDEEFVKVMIGFCNNLKEIFDKITSGNCSVSIKVPIKEHVDEKTLLSNLCRDSVHLNMRNTDGYKSTRHSIIGNTCFSVALNNVLKGNSNRYYLNNDIPNTKNYLNTSKGCYGETEELPYKSELVFAIVPSLNQEKGKFHCHGFLCIDCDKINAFNTKYEIALVEGVVDGIYDIIYERSLNKNIEQNHIKDEQQNQSGESGIRSVGTE